MKIAFYSPLKPPGHPVPSGDRLMARQLMQCLGRAGHSVTVASDLRAFLRDPAASGTLDETLAAAGGETDRLRALWTAEGAPDLWFCYHPYYKAPDLIGPDLCRAFDVPYVTAEASYSRRRNTGGWAGLQDRVLDSVRMAVVNICFTGRDHAGLRDAAPGARLARMKPFIDTGMLPGSGDISRPAHLVCVAMMRAGDKMNSYTRLAAALNLIKNRDWTLSIIGDGPLRTEVQALFAGFGDRRILWHGQQDAAQVAGLLAQGALYVWPGCGEAYGLAYLEAQAAGLPVVAYEIAGVPEVVADGVTGVLTEPDDDAAYATAIIRLLDDDTRRNRMAEAARHRVQSDHSLDAATQQLMRILADHVGANHDR